MSWLSRLAERVVGRPDRHRQPEALEWRVQRAVHPLSTDPCSALLHVARSGEGTFEIFDDEGFFLLHFPRSMKMPAELFRTLSEAKDRAALALQAEATQ